MIQVPLSVGVVAVSALAVAMFPRSVLVFLLFQGSLLFVYRARIPERLRWSLLAAALLVLMPVIGYFNSYYLEVATQVGIFVALALGLNIVVGLAGLLDLGYVAFFAVGAYSWAIFGSPHANVVFGGESFPLAGGWFYLFLLVGLGVAALTGVLLGLPVLRLHGACLALVRLGFGEVIRVLANNLDKPINFTNGPKGITPISRPPTPLGLPYGEYFYFLALLIVIVVVLVNRRLENSHIGRAWEAIREDELAARAMGVPLVRMKLMAFACGASFAGIMGVLFSAKQIFINPESFTFLESIGVLAMVILGGMGSIPGAILGATVVTVLNLQVLKGFSLWLNELKNAGVTVLGYSLADLPTQFEPAKYERMVTFRDRSILGRRPDQITALGICRTFQNIRLFANITAIENVLVGMNSRIALGLWDVLSHSPGFRRTETAAAARALALLERVGLQANANDVARNLPYGDRRRLELARALASEPALLLLDEPTAGMTRTEAGALMRLLRELVLDLGLAILLTEHNMPVVLDVSDWVTVLDHGERIAEGAPREVQENE